MQPVSRGVTICAPAKINLFLHVGDRGADGFHALESLVAFTQCGDRLEMHGADDLTLTVSGIFGAAVPSGASNLVLRAAHALRERMGTAAGARIVLEKNIPVAAGLGGGSADAASVLRALNLLWNCGLSEDVLVAIAAELGSDIPACVLSRPLWMAGRGERVMRIDPFPSLAVVLVNPGVSVPTAPVFAKLRERTGLGAVETPFQRLETVWDMEAYLEGTRNDLEAPAREDAPIIGDVLHALGEEPGCILARMSGSGATCFGLFDGRHFALRSAENLAVGNPTWWVRATRIAAADIGAPHWMA